MVLLVIKAETLPLIPISKILAVTISASDDSL